MKKLVAVVALAAAAPALPARPVPMQADASASPFVFEEAMIPMRDGVKLHTVILRPRDAKGPLPILFSRTPYGAPTQAPGSLPGSWAALAKDGYIFVTQDMRGRFKSEGGKFTL